MDEYIKKESDELMRGKEEWLDKHGEPDFEYLNSLVEDGNPKALEILTNIAEHHNVTYSEDTSPEEIVEMILLALSQNQ